MSIEYRIDSIGGRLRILRLRLIENGFEFDRDDEALPGPEHDTDEAIQRIENEIGAVPLALKLFWKRVGSIDFCGGHPEWLTHPDGELDGCPDPIVIYPPSVTNEELDEFLSDKEERLRCNSPYVVPIAPDLYHKADISGGMVYNVSVPAIADNPPLNNEWHETTFLDYLEIAVKWAGFPGLEQHPKHTWPIAKLVEGL